MRQFHVLKFGSSVLRTVADLPVAVDEIYRRWRAGDLVLAVFSAFDGVTDQLINEAAALFGSDCPEATAAYVATGEQRTAALLVGSLGRAGIPSRLVEPREIDLIAEGTLLESAPVRVNVSEIERLWRGCPILVLPGFYGIDHEGRTTLFGRGGSDLSALFLAKELRATCVLLKDVDGVCDSDPAADRAARRFEDLSWRTALAVAGSLIQPKALRYAHSRGLPFDVSRPNEHVRTRVGAASDEWAYATTASRPLRVALLGCGVVGRGVYDRLQSYRQRFEVRHVVVRDLSKHHDIDERTTDHSVAFAEDIDLVVECLGGTKPSYALIAHALAAGKSVITANKAVVAAHWADLVGYTQGPQRRLWFGAAVGGAVPVLEILEQLRAAHMPVREIRGIVNGTCGVVLDALADGKTLKEAIHLAQVGGFAESDPTRDLSGLDATDKLSLLTAVAFSQSIPPRQIPTQGIDSIVGKPTRQHKLVARACLSAQGVIASVAIELLQLDSFLSGARGAENRIEIELMSGDLIRLHGQGAGRWPTSVAVMGDVHHVARRLQGGASVHDEALVNRGRRSTHGDAVDYSATS